MPLLFFVLLGVGAAALLYVRHLRAPLAEGPRARVALVGDSLAVGLGPALKKLADAEGIPFWYEGHSGTTPAQWAGHVAGACGTCGGGLASFQPTVVLVSLGTNDFGRAVVDLTPYATLRDRFTSLPSHVVWIDPPPMTRDVAGARAAIAALGVPVAHISALPQVDGVHPTPSGYATWAKHIWSLLRERQPAGSDTLSR